MPSLDLSALVRLNAAVLSDVLDSLGLMNQAMRPFMRPLDDALQLIGRARTGLYMPVYEHVAGENPYQVEIALVDDLKPGDVVVLISTSGKSPNLHAAARAARSGGVAVGGLLGGDGGPLAGLVDEAIIVPASETSLIQELHLLVDHAIVDLVEEGLRP